MKTSLVLLLLASLFLSACAAEPFVRPALPVLKNPDPIRIRAQFQQTIPDRFIADDTVLIDAPFHDDIAVISVLRVNRPADTFELMGLNHLGLKLFHLGGNSKQQEIRFAVPPLVEQKTVLTGIAVDTTRMYFNLAPPTDAEIKVHDTFVRYCVDTPDGTLIYELGGQPVVLLEKRLESFWGTQWRVRYYDYVSGSTGLYPRGIVMDNGRYHYRIIVKNRVWQAQ